MDFENLHQILRSLYDEMMPLCSDMTDIAKGLAGLGALFYVALRVWLSLVRSIWNGTTLSLRSRKLNCNAWMQPNGTKKNR